MVLLILTHLDLLNLFPLGSRLLYGNTVYAYGRLAASAVTAGKCVTHAASIAHHFDLTPTAGVAAGETAISVEKLLVLT